MRRPTLSQHVLAVVVPALITGASIGAARLFVALRPAPVDFNADAVASGLPAGLEAGEDELRILKPLVAGSPLLDFTIDDIHAVRHGVVQIVCSKGPARAVLEIALVDESGAAPPPPATAGRYAVYYSVRHATDEDGSRLAQALASTLKANAHVPPPRGMSTFKPDPSSGVRL